MIKLDKIKKTAGINPVIGLLLLGYVASVLSCIGIFRHINACDTCRPHTNINYAKEYFFTFTPIFNTCCAVIVCGPITFLMHVNHSHSSIIFGARP